MPHNPKTPSGGYRGREDLGCRAILETGAGKLRTPQLQYPFGSPSVQLRRASEKPIKKSKKTPKTVSYTHLRAHET